MGIAYAMTLLKINKKNPPGEPGGIKQLKTNYRV
jgi:hypothetical protein